MSQKPNPAHFLTVADVARELGLCRETVTRQIGLGLMPGTKFGTQYRISRQQWEDYKAGTWRAATIAPADLLRRKAG